MYQFRVDRDTAAPEPDLTWIYTAVTPADPTADVGVTSGGGGLCSGHFNIYSTDGLTVWNLTPALQAGGTIDGQAFEWLCDGDSRLGPVLEAVINGRYCWVPFSALKEIHIEPPTDLRDLVWAAAHLEFPNGGASVALIPTRYPRSVAFDDERVWLSRRTEWQPLPGSEDDQYAGIGQRVLMSDQGEAGLLDVRLIELRK